MKISRRTLLAFAAAAGCGQRGSGYQGYALVPAAGSKSVAVIDLRAFARKGSIPVPFEPTGLAVDPDPAARSAFAVMAGSACIAEVSPKSPGVLRRITLPAKPRAVRVSGSRLYWIAEDRNWLGIIDLKEWKNQQPVQLASRAVDLDVSLRAPLAAVTLDTGAIQMVAADTRRAEPPIEIGEGLGSIRFRSDGACLIVAQPEARALTFVDTASRALMVRLNLALKPQRLRMKSDGGQLFITGEGTDGVSIVYPYRTEVAQTFLSGRHPGEMADSSAPDYLFVANPGAGSVTVFSIENQRVVAVTGVGERPGPIVVTPDQQYALVLNMGSGDLAVIRIAAIAPGREKRAPLFTMIPVGASPCGIAVLEA